MCFSLRPADRRTHGSRQIHEKKSARRRHKVGPFAAPLSPLDCAALSLGGESKAFAEAFSPSASARSLARRAAGGGQKRARVAELFMYGYERDGTRTRIAT